MSDNQELTIIRDVQSGNHENYRYLVERYHRGLIQHLYNLMHDEQAAEDVAQEAFIRAFNKLGQYNEAFAFSTWLYKIADNLAFRQLKRTRSMRSIEDVEDVIPDDAPSAAEVTDRLFTQEAVRKAMSTLPMEYRQVITLYYWDNFSYEEIATIIDCPVGTVRTWLHRAKSQLRKELYGQI